LVTRNSDDGWSMQLDMQRGTERYERALSADSCEALADAAVVIAAAACPSLQTPPSASLQPPMPVLSASDPGPAPPTPALPLRQGREPSQPTRPHPRAPSRPRASEPVVALGSRVAGALGPGPLPSLLAGASLGVVWPRVDVVLAVEASPRRRVSAPAPSIDIRLATASVTTCPSVPLGGSDRATLGLCVGFEAGAMIGTGVGTPRTRAAAQPWLAIPGGARVRWWVRPRIALGGQAEVAYSLTRPAFVLDGFGVGFRASPLAARARLFAELRLW